MASSTNTEHVGLPDVKVVVVNTAQQYIGPSNSLDIGIDGFYQTYGNPNIRSDNVYFMDDLGVAMVKPLFTNRSNYLFDSTLPSPSRYQVEVPKNKEGYEESTEEKERSCKI